GLGVAFSASCGTATGAVSSTSDHNDGTYTATFTGGGAGTATTIGATIGGVAVSTTLPTISVTTGGVSVATSTITVSAATIASGATSTLTLHARDAAGNDLATGGLAVAFSFGGGTR